MTKARTLADNFAADINGITAGTGITGGGTSGTVTITNDMATTIAAKGDLVVGTGNDTYNRLAVASTAGYVLSVDSAETTGLKWAVLPAAIPTNAVDAVSALEGTSSASYTNLATNGPTVTLTTGTKALVILTAEFRADDSNDNCAMGFEVSGASTVSASDSNRLAFPGSLPSTGIYICFSWVGIITGLTAGSNTFTCKYKNDGGAGTVNFRNRRISVVDMGS